MIWLQLNGSRAPHRQIDQRIQARKLIDDAIATGDLQDRVFTFGATKYVRRVVTLGSGTDLREITVAVYDQQDDTPQFTRGKIALIHAP
jgi:hypothetical protein